VGYAHFLARSAEIETALEVQPMSAGGQFAVPPAAAAVEFGNQHEPAIVGGIELASECGDLGFQFLEGKGGGEACRCAVHTGSLIL
jgi:hypothetical protein